MRDVAVPFARSALDVGGTEADAPVRTDHTHGHLAPIAHDVDVPATRHHPLDQGKVMAIGRMFVQDVCRRWPLLEHTFVHPIDQGPHAAFELIPGEEQWKTLAPLAPLD